MRIRIIPMSLDNEEFVGKTIEEIQLYYFNESLVKENKYWYHYQKQGLRAEEDDLLLFQMDNRVIASAKLDSVVRFLKSDSYGNHGALILKHNSIKTFKPITKDELSRMIFGFDSFNQSKQDFDSNDVDIDKLNIRMDS